MSRSADYPSLMSGKVARSRADSALVCMSEISNMLARPRKLEDALEEVLRLISSEPQICSGLIAFFDVAGQLRSVTHDGPYNSVHPTEAERLLQNALRQILTAGKPLVLRNSPGLLVSRNRESAGKKSLIGVPIKGDWAAMGAILIERDRVDESPSDGVSEDICFLTILGGLLAQRLALRQLTTGAAPQFNLPSCGALRESWLAGSFERGDSQPNRLVKSGARGRLVSRGKSPEASDRQMIIEAMTRAGWVQAKAARLLGVSSRQIRYALQKHSIEVKRF